MSEFPTTQIEHLTLSRLIIGSNWFLGYSHTSKAKDDLIKATQDRQRLTEIVEVFLRAGVNATMGIRPEAPHYLDAVREAEDRTGRGCIRIATPHLNIDDGPEALDETARILDAQAECGADICMPHQAVTDALVDRRTRSIPKMDVYCKMIRERGMLPGLSTHMPETPVYADETELDVATYIQLYNAAGFLMQIEADWVHRMIWNAKKPVMTIKPLAAGQLLPLVGLAFVWATLRPIDMVTIGTYTADEAREVIDISLSLLEQRASSIELQKTRSKASVASSK
jgi:hypothetical protein